MIHPIVLYGDPILRRRASPVTRFDEELERLAADMVETMYAADGVGLAAPQIALPIRLFVALEVAGPDDGGAREGQVMDDPADEDMTPEQKRRAWGVLREHVLVNPQIVESSGRQFGRDGCLSLPGLSVEDVPRARSVVLEYQDLAGEKRRLEAEDYFAHVLQHELDHLEGVLYFDHLPERSREQFLEENRSLLAVWQREARAVAKEREKRGSRRQTIGRA